MAGFIDRLWGSGSDAAAAGIPGTSHHWEPLSGDDAEGSTAFDEDRLQRLTDTRKSLHGIAEQLMAGPQHRESETIRLRVTDTGFKTTQPPAIELDGSDLVAGDKRIAAHGTFTHLADELGVTAAGPFDVYDQGPDDDPRKDVIIDEDARYAIVSALHAGDIALRELAPDQVPVLWPEHFDVAVSVDEVTYGVSAGDSEIATPYAYVAPSTKPDGNFWAFSFGAAIPVRPDTPIEVLVDFFTEGRTRTSTA